MKTTPIYILLIIFFLNFDLAWGQEEIGCFERQPWAPHLIQIQYNVMNNKEIFHSINIAYYLNSAFLYDSFRYNSLIPTHKLRLNLGLSKVLAEFDYEIGLFFKVSSNFYIMPYLSAGSSIYNYTYGAGTELNYKTKAGVFITGTFHYRASQKLFGQTNAEQWYQSGFGGKIGITGFLK